MFEGKKKIVAATIAVLATVGVAAPVGISAAYAASAPVLKEGTRSNRVSGLQYLLRANGFNIEIDGSFGPATKSAVKSFQARNGLVQDGIVGPKTLAKLSVVTRYGTEGNRVRAVQTLLRNSGQSVSVDGSFGPRTLGAVKAFQKSKGLAQDGVVGPQTWGALFGATKDSTPPPPPPVDPGPPKAGDITRGDLEKMFPGKVADTSRVEQGLPYLNAEMRKRGIASTPQRKAAFLATLAHESTFDYAIGERGYDPLRYRGRGYIQITGPYNYEAAGKGIGVDLMGDNQVRASQLPYSPQIAGWYWTQARPNSNAAADQFNMGLISKYVGYDNTSTARARAEDGERCDSFKRAYKYIAGRDAPASTKCNRP
ncbi:hypothetical protein CGZ96_01535 [Enemella evansiae]|uniref:peptidoglycan-binding protein n=1 Tax=Enemella evansiae TaxID=2016499 RepID=UPI000B964AAA|nr:peptidoglycan-binding protein [Enemella evansiae]OYO03329.1 hypothetical protein CGZ96_01535 [Enemella evansiae]